MDQILSSWKEIAAYFGKGVRTVQRWEQSLGLPVRRPAGAMQNIVFARTGELSQWLEDASLDPNRSSALKTILLLETDEQNRSHRLSILENSGFIVIASRAVERTLEILKRGPRVDLLIADMNLIADNSVTHELLTLTSSVPVIGLSSERDGGTVQQIGWHVWDKNDTSVELAVTVQNLCGDYQTGARKERMRPPNSETSRGASHNAAA